MAEDYAILFDATKCTGCRACQIACKSWNEREWQETTNRGTYENPPSISSDCWMRILFNEGEEDGKPYWYFTKYQCMHCTEATCIEVCPTGATKRNGLGIVETDRKKCIGCNYCVATCPFQACMYSQKEKTIYRCRLCVDRIVNSNSDFPNFMNSNPDFTGELRDAYPRNIPSCVYTCTTNALCFGTVNEMIKAAESRVADIKRKQFPKAQVYGIRELGGLHYLYVLQDSPDKFGLPVNPSVPNGVSIWKTLVKPENAWGGLALAGLGLVAAVNFAINRREAGMRKEE